MLSRLPPLLLRALAGAMLMAAGAGIAQAGSVAVVNPRCEYLVNPQGIDVTRPRLSWMMEIGDQRSEPRGQKQSAYQVLVASTPELLAKDQGDLWDSGKVASSQSVHVEYAGKQLESRLRCHWKVRVWLARSGVEGDEKGTASAWSPLAQWSMGLLKAEDWQAQWISDPVLADPANRPLTPIHCYRSELASRPDAAKWIVLDLGAAKRMDAVDVIPARPKGQSWDFRTAMFPERFRIEVADTRDFLNARTVVDRTRDDVPNPRANECRCGFPAVTARFVRLTVTRLARWDGRDYGLALGGLAVCDGTQSIAIGAAVECSDSLETENWSKRFLVDGKAAVAIAADSPALAADVADVPAKFTVSRVPMLRREFTIDGEVRRAVLSISARGFYEARINGRRVGDELLAPGCTDPSRRIQYQSHDVTALLRRGSNVLGALLGYGWYAGHVNLFENRCIDGYFPQLLAQLDVETADGRRLTIASDANWRSTLAGPVRSSDLLDGEACDYRRDLPGWDQPGYDDRTWGKVWSQPRDEVALVWQRSQPVRAIREVRPVAVKETKPGIYVFDLGQEVTGWCRLKVDGPTGTHLRLRHAELVAADGNIDMRNLWGTAQQEDYFLDGKGLRILEPHFTYHGFRYVELSGLPGPPDAETLVVVNLRSALPDAGRFECSNPLFNRIMTAARWTQWNMLFDVPTGCAARSERLGWLGDIRPCVQTASFSMDAAAFFAKYAVDMRDAQKSDGRFTDIAPHAHLRGSEVCVGSPGWADAGVSLPWQQWVNYADRRALEEHCASAKRWVDFIHSRNPDLLWNQARGQDWGDWMSAGTATPKDLGATAFFAHSADLVARMAAALGRHDEAERYRTLFAGIRQAFGKRWVADDGIIAAGRAGGAEADVTACLAAAVKDGRVSLVVGNETLGGDPAPGVVKRLRLVYRLGGQEATRDLAEGATLELAAPAGQRLEILKASYGGARTGSGVGGDAQGSYALALHFGLLEEPIRTRAVERLVEAVKRNGGHPSTGFWSSIELLLALSANGQHATAAHMLALRDKPSWGYMVDNGTTFWEAFNAPEGNLSLNHWTHSAVGEWLWRNVAGLSPDEQHPGYAGFTIHPRPTQEVSWCKASYDSIRGKITVNWQSEGDTFTMEVTIPVNTTATVFVPARDTNAVTESGEPAANAKGVKFLRMENGAAVYEVGSGAYRFEYR